VEQRNFFLGFGFIFLVIFFLVGLAIYNRVAQRARAAIPVDQTATAERLALIENLKFGLSATPTIKPTETPRPRVPTFTASPTVWITTGFTATVSSTLTPFTATPQPGQTRTPGTTQTNTPKPTVTPTGTVTPAAISLTGRLLKEGVPVSGASLTLEDLGTQVLASTTTAADGSYLFPNLAQTTTQYNVAFTHDDNSQFGADEVVSWAWLGPIQLPGQGELSLPDFEIAPLGFGKVSPIAEAEVSVAGITAFTPLHFAWTAYPGAGQYWVDLYEGEDEPPVWISALVSGTTVSFNGTLTSGSRIAPGDYWWGIGAIKDVEVYMLTVYEPLDEIYVIP
jgi:hypothetical protein